MTMTCDSCGEDDCDFCEEIEGDAVREVMERIGFRIVPVHQKLPALDIPVCRHTYEIIAGILAELSAPAPRDYLLERVNKLEQQVAIVRGVPADKLFGVCPGCLEKPCTHKTPACARGQYCPSCKHNPCDFSGRTCPREGLR